MQIRPISPTPIALKDLERHFMYDSRSIRRQAERSDRKQVLRSIHHADLAALCAVGAFIMAVSFIAGCIVTLPQLY